MKTLVIVYVLIVGLFSCTEKNQPQETQQENWRTYKNTLSEISFPKDWLLEIDAYKGESYWIYSPIFTTPNQFRNYVFFIVEDLTEEYNDLATYTAHTEEIVKTYYTDGKILLSENSTNKNGPHHKLIYTATQEQFNLRFEKYFWVKNNKMHVLTFVCEKDKYALYKNESNKLLESFKLK